MLNAQSSSFSSMFHHSLIYQYLKSKITGEKVNFVETCLNFKDEVAKILQVSTTESSKSELVCLTYMIESSAFFHFSHFFRLTLQSYR